MKIKMFDVNFGETIIYEEQNNKVLVDCGARFDGTGKLAYGRIKQEIDKDTKLIITHFDEDHYNGICEVPNSFRFKEIILPLYIYKNQQSNTMDFFIDTLRTWTYMMAIGKSKKIASLHKLFLKLPYLVNSIYDIRCVGKGDSIFAGHREFKVLWPQKDLGINSRLYSDEILKLLRETTDNLDTLEIFVENADKYVSLFAKIYQFYASNMRNDQYDGTINGDNFHQELNNLNILFETLYKTQLELNLDMANMRIINSISSIKINGMNECSIVFESDNDLVAFGDASERVIKYLKKNNELSYDEYKVVKVQHHGTNKYWSNYIPKAKAYLVSNSGGKHINWSISEKYGKCFNGKMICTNDNCQRCKYYSCGMGCSCCNIGVGQIEFVVDTSTL